MKVHDGIYKVHEFCSGDLPDHLKKIEISFTTDRNFNTKAFIEYIETYDPEKKESKSIEVSIAVDGKWVQLATKDDLEAIKAKITPKGELDNNDIIDEIRRYFDDRDKGRITNQKLIQNLTDIVLTTGFKD